MHVHNAIIPKVVLLQSMYGDRSGAKSKRKMWKINFSMVPFSLFFMDSLVSLGVEKEVLN